MNHMPIREIYRMFFNKYLSNMTTDYYEPKFVCDAVITYVQTHQRARNAILEDMKQSITFEHILEHFFSINKELENVSDSIYTYIASYGKLMKILNKVKGTRHLNIYRLRQWIYQAKYVCKQMSKEYNSYIEYALIIYYIIKVYHIPFDEACQLLINKNLLEEGIDTEKIKYIISSKLDGAKYKYYECYVFLASIVLPPATTDSSFSMIKCALNSRSTEKSHRLSYLYYIKDSNTPDRQSAKYNPYYAEVFEKELLKEKNIINNERKRLMNTLEREDEYTIWFPSSLIINVAEYMHSRSAVNMLEALKTRVKRAKLLAKCTEQGYTPELEFALIVDELGINREDRKVVFYNNFYDDLSAFARIAYGMNLDNIFNEEYSSDDMEDILYGSTLPPLSFEIPSFVSNQCHVMHYDTISNTEIMQRMSKVSREIINKTHPMYNSKLYIKCYNIELKRLIDDVCTPIVADVNKIFARYKALK